MPPAPEVLSGMRAPRTVRLEEARQREAAASGAPPVLPSASPDVTVYVSKYASYRVQITAPSVYADPTTGRKAAAGKMYVAEFQNGMYRNGAPGTPGHRNPEVRALFDEALQTNPYFGPFASNSSAAVHFWLMGEQLEAVEKSRVKAAFDVLRTLPAEQVAAFAATLSHGTADDHEPAAKQQGAKPIPPAAQQ